MSNVFPTLDFDENVQEIKQSHVSELIWTSNQLEINKRIWMVLQYVLRLFFSDLLSLLSSYVFDVFFGFFKATHHNTTPITGTSEKPPSRSSTICGQSTCGVGQHVRVHPWNCLGIPGDCVLMCLKNATANLGMPRNKTWHFLWALVWLSYMNYILHIVIMSYEYEYI